MELMIVKDVMLGKGGYNIITGPLLLKGFARRSDVEKAFGEKVAVSNVGGQQLIVHVKGVSVSQAMSGSWQVSVAVDCPSELGAIALDSLVTDGR